MVETKSTYVATYKSRHGGDDHVIVEDQFGGLYCTTCPGALHERTCWAVATERARRLIDRAMKKLAATTGKSVFRSQKEILIKEQWDYLDSQKAQ